MPFVTEALWSEIKESHLLLGTSWPKYNKDWINKKAEHKMEQLKAVVTGLRVIRTEHAIPPQEKVDALIYGYRQTPFLKEKVNVIQRLGRLQTLTLERSGKKPVGAFSSVLKGGTELYVIRSVAKKHEGVGNAEHTRLQNELTKLREYLLFLEKRLGNQAFTKNAPAAVVEKERAKLAEASAKAKKLERLV